MSDNVKTTENNLNTTAPSMDVASQIVKEYAATPGANVSSQMYLIEQNQAANNTVEINIKVAQLNKVQVEFGKKYRIVKKTEVKGDAKIGDRLNVLTEELQDQVIAVKRGENLELSYSSGTIVELAGFYQANASTASGAVDSTSLILPGDGDSTALLTSDALGAGANPVSLGQGAYLLYAHGDANSLQDIAQGNEALANAITTQESSIGQPVAEQSNAPYLLLGGLLGLGGIAAAVASGSKGGSSSTSATPATPQAPAQTVISGDVVLGPVLESGNGLKVLALKADGTLLGSAAVGSTGAYRITYDPSYTGIVLLKVIDVTIANDYKDEATAADKDLNSNLYAVVAPVAGGVNDVHITPLTTLAAKRIGITEVSSDEEKAVGDRLSSASTTAVDIAAINIAVAQEFVDQATTAQITAMRPTPTITAAGQAQDGDAYGKVLAQISSFEKNNGISTQAAIESIYSAGVKFLAPTSDIIAANNIINAAERNAGITITGTNEAGATVTVNGQAATVTGTTWQYSMDAAAINDLGQGSKTFEIIETDDRGNKSASNNHVVIIDTVLPTGTAVDAIAANNIINAAERNAGITITGTNEAGATVTVNGQAATVTGTTWQYSMDAAAINDLGQGQQTLSIVTTDVAGNTSTTTKDVIIDTVLPEVSVAALAVPVTGSGAHVAVQSTELGMAYLLKDDVIPTSVANITSAADSKWNSVQITVQNENTLLSTGGLANGTYHAYVADENGNLSAISSNTVTVDAIAPTVESVQISSAVSGRALVAGDEVLVTLGMSEAVNIIGTPSYLINLGGLTKEAVYRSDISDSDSLVFAYTISAGDSDLVGGVTAAANSLMATQDQITDLVGNYANASTAAVIVGNNNLQVDSIAPSVANTSAFGVSNLDVTSNIVLKFDSAVTALTGGHISLINDANGNGKTGYHDESINNSIDLYFGASSTTTGVTTVQVFSDVDHTIASGTLTINDSTGVVTIDPLRDLDLSNNYHLVVAANSFQKTSNGLKNAEIGVADNLGNSVLGFATVTPGEGNQTGSLLSAADSLMWGADGVTFQSGRSWIGIDGLGTDSSRLNLNAGDKNYTFVLKNLSVDPHEASAVSTYVNFQNFNKSLGGDILYFDQQNNALNGSNAPSNLEDGALSLVPNSNPLSYNLVNGTNNAGGAGGIGFIGFTYLNDPSFVAGNAVIFG